MHNYTEQQPMKVQFHFSVFKYKVLVIY